MTHDPESTLFDFAASNRAATNEEEELMTELHAALGMSKVPIRLMRPPIVKQAPDWRKYFYMAVAALLVIAIIGSSISLLAPDQNDQDHVASVPPVVLGLASPDATTIGSDICELGASIPVISGTSTSPVGGPALLLTPDGDLVLDCAGEQNMLASGIESVTPWAYPGVVGIYDGEMLSYLNIITGDSYTPEDMTHLNALEPIRVITMRTTTRLMIVPATGSPTDAAVLDFATLEETPLTDHNGNSIPLANIPVATSNYQGDCMVVAYSNHQARQNTSYLGGYVVIPAEGSARSYQSPDIQAATPRELATSPNCDQVASATFQGEQQAGTTTITIQTLNAGAGSVTAPMETPDLSTHITWLKSGTGIVYASGESLMLWELPFDDSEPVQLAEGIVVDSISLTRDPNIVSVAGIDFSEDRDSARARTLIANTSTQEVLELEGYDMYPSRNLKPRERNILLMQPQHPQQPQVYDSVTGELLGNLQGEPAEQQNITIAGPDQLIGTEISLVGTNQDDLWRVLDSEGQPIFEQVDPPAGLELTQQRFVASMSNDGWVYLSSTTTSPAGWIKSLDDPNAEWIGITFDPESEYNNVQFLNTEGVAVSSTATPEASSVPDAVCDLTGDVPIFSAVNESPIDEPSILVTLDRELKLVCDGNETLLAEGVTMAAPMQRSYVLMAVTDDGPLLLNIVTGERLLIPRSQAQSEQSLSIGSWGPWIVLPSTQDWAASSLYNLESFAEIPILAGEIPVDQELISSMAVSANDEIIALTITSEESDESDIITGIFIADTDGTSRFIETTVQGEPRQMAISLDGQMVAIRSFEGTGFSGANTLTLIRTDDGATVNSWEIGQHDAFIDLVWLNDGSALLFTDGEALYRVTSSDGEREAIFDGEQVQGLVLTRDDNVIAISHIVASETGPAQPKTTIINLETGETITLDGRDMWAGSASLATRRTTLVLAQSHENTSGGLETRWSITRVAVNAITGETIGELDHTDPDTEGFSHSSWGNDRDITVLAFGPDSMWRLVDEEGNPTLERIPPPPIDLDSGEEAMSLVISPEGYISLRIFDPSSTWVMLPGEDGWIEVDVAAPEDSKGVHPAIWFIPGDDVRPVPSPTATPVASLADSTVCDLTGDTPIFMGMDSPPNDDPAVLITTSGELKRVCNGEETLLAEGVDFAFPMTVPDTVMAETADGFLIINITSGNSLEFPYSAEVVLQNQSLIAPWGSWMVAPSRDNTLNASIYDLRTLTETPILTVGDNPGQMSSIAGLSVNATDTHAVVAISFMHSPSSQYLQGFFVVEANGQHRFVQTEPDVVPRAIVISPNGETIATSWYQGTMQTGETNITLYNAADGQAVESWNMPTADIQTEITWLDDGSGLVFTDGNGLYLIDAEHPGDGFLVLLEGEQVSGIVLTPNEKVVAVSMTEQSETGPPTSQTAIVNTETGSVILLDGRDLWASSYGPASKRTVLVLLDLSAPQLADSLTMTVVNAATGEVVGEIEHHPPASMRMSISNATSQQDRGDINVFSMGTVTTWQLLDENGEPSLKEIIPPDGRSGQSDNDLLVTMDNDGRIAMTFFDPFEVWLWLPDSDHGEWIQLDISPPQNDLGIPIVVMFIPGSD